MTEKEKMQRQLLYDANSAELLQSRINAKKTCQKYNLLAVDDVQGQDTLIRELLGSAGENCTVQAPFWCDYGYNIKVGKNFFANHNTVILDGAEVIFGDNVFIAPNCGFYTAGHPIDHKRRNAGLEYAYPINVGSNVWIGAGVHVMPGVKIGDDVVIGGGSVVVKDIPGGVVAVGNPCRAIRFINDTDEQQAPGA